MVNRLLSKPLIFLIIDFKILGHVEKKIFFPENTIFKGIIFWYFQTATCYNSSLVLSRLDPALVKAACNIAVLNLMETLWFPFMPCYWCWKECGPVYHGFQLMPRSRSTRYLFSVIATNKLKSKVLKNNTMNGKNLRIIWWMVREGRKGDSTYRAPRKAFPIN